MLKYFYLIICLLAVLSCSNELDDEVYYNNRTFNTTISNKDFEQINEQIVSLIDSLTVTTRSTKPMPVPTGISIHHNPNLEKMAKELFKPFVSEGQKIVNTCLAEFHDYVYIHKYAKMSQEDLKSYQNLSDVQKAYIGYFVSFYNNNTNIPANYIYQSCEVLNPVEFLYINQNSFPLMTPNGNESNGHLNFVMRIINSFTFSPGVETRCFCDLFYSVTEFNRLLTDRPRRDPNAVCDLSLLENLP